jgi:hypothetical protein
VRRLFASRGREVRSVAFDRHQAAADDVSLFGLNDRNSWRPVLGSGRTSRILRSSSLLSGYFSRTSPSNTVAAHRRRRTTIERTFRRWERPPGRRGTSQTSSSSGPHHPRCCEAGAREGGVADDGGGVVEVSIEAADTARKILELRERHRKSIAEHLGRAAGNVIGSWTAYMSNLSTRCVSYWKRPSLARTKIL